MLRPTRKGLLLLLAVLLLQQCDVLEPGKPSVPEPAKIKFLAFGGFAGAVFHRLTITEEGMAINERTRPPLKKKLAEPELQEILALFSRFETLKDEYQQNVCADDVRFEITLIENGRSKTVVTYGCTIYIHPTQEADLQILKAIIDRLSALSDEIYREMAPWQGLRADFSLDQQTYGVGEPIHLFARVNNPTAELRSLFFDSRQRVGFSVAKQAFPGFHYFFPEKIDTAGHLTRINFKPGETMTFQQTWDQTYPDREGSRHVLEPGRYRLSAGLLDTRPLSSNQILVFDVVNRDVPLAGFVEPDYNGASRHADSYTFTLEVHNWTDQPVVLHFPYRQKLSIELYDADRPALDPLPLLFKAPAERLPAESVETLQPGEARVYQATFNKAELNLTFTAYYVKIKLLVLDWVFERDGKISIFH